MGREKCRNDILVFGEIWGKRLYIAKNNHISNTVKMLKNSKKRAKLRQKPLKMPVFSLVPVIGVEPIRYHYHWILSPARLPIPPHRQSH